MSLVYKFFETGSCPYYLNLNNTAKDFSFQESTSPQHDLLGSLANFIIIPDNTVVQDFIIQKESKGPTHHDPSTTH